MNIENLKKDRPVNPSDLMSDPNFPKFDDDGMAFNDFQKAYIEKYVRTTLSYFFDIMKKYEKYENRKNERLAAMMAADSARSAVEWEIPNMRHNYHDSKSPAYMPEEVSGDIDDLLPF